METSGGKLPFAVLSVDGFAQFALGSRLREQCSKSHASETLARFPLKCRETTLEGTNDPTVFGPQRLEGRPRFVERADISILDGSPRRILLDPAKRQPLSPTDVRAMRVDPARVCFVEEGARSGRVSPFGGEKTPIVPLYLIRFDPKDREVVDAAARTPDSAVETVSVPIPQLSRPRGHLRVKFVQVRLRVLVDIVVTHYRRG